MKKDLFLLALLVWGWQTNAQTLNQAANWPNTNWTLNVIEHTGSYAQDIEADPTDVANFAYDDDDTGPDIDDINPNSHDVIAAESPVIDLTVANTAGEHFLKVSGDYVYTAYGSNEYLAIEYWDADTSAWTLWHQFPNQNTAGTPTNHYCSGTHENYVSSFLDISGFTASQLSGFKYRFIYNDDTTGGNGWNYGFCFSSPTISSSSVAYTAPVATATVIDDCANNQFSVAVEVTDLGGATSVTVSDDQGSATQQVTSVPTTVNFGTYNTSVFSTNFTVTNDQENIFITNLNAMTGCAPTNDECNNAMDVPVNPDMSCVNVTHGTTLNATPSPQIDDVTGTPDDDVWFKFIATNNEHIISLTNVSSVIGTYTNMGMGLYSGSCNNLTLIQDSSSDLIAVNILTVGETYYLRVYGLGAQSLSAKTEFDVCVITTMPPINDECDNAIDVPVNPDMNGTNLIHGTTEFATPSNQTSNAKDVWFKFTATATTGVVRITNTGNRNVTISLYSGNCGNLTHILTNSRNFLPFSNLTIGQTYYLRVFDSSFDQSGNFDVWIGTLPAPPVNDDCTNAINLTVNNSQNCNNIIHGNTNAATPSFPTQYPKELDIWYKFTATETAVKIDILNYHSVYVDGAGFKPNISLYSGDCNNLTPVNNLDSHNINIFQNLTIGETYYLVFHNSSYYSYVTFAYCYTEFDFCVTNLIFPENSECETAIPLMVNPDSNCTKITHLHSSIKPLWFTFTATSTIHVLSGNNIINDKIHMSLFSGDCNSFSGRSIHKENRHYVARYLTIGETYYLKIFFESDAFFGFDLCILTPQPPLINNDECINAIDLPINTGQNCTNTIHGSNVFATTSPQPGGQLDHYYRDIWYKFSATSSSCIVKFTNINYIVGNNHYIEVYSGNCSNLTYISNSVNLNGLIVGETYYVRIYSGSSRFEFDICIQDLLPSTPLTNDECDDAINLTVNPDFTCTNVTHGTTIGATATPQPNDVAGSTYNDVWYKFTAISNYCSISFMNISNPLIYHLSYRLYSGDCNNLTLIHNDTKIIDDLTVGETYYIRVNRSDDRTTNFDICVKTPSPPSYTCSDAIDLPVNPDMNCANTTHTYLNAGAYSQSNWYKFTATSTKHVINFSPQNLPISRYTLYSGDCNNLTIIGNNIYSAVNLTIGNTYYLKISSHRYSYKEFDICIKTPPTPINDECDNAIDVPINYDSSCTNTTHGTITGATASPQPDDVDGVPNDDVWYKFTPTRNIVAEITNSQDLENALYSGYCNNLTLIPKYLNRYYNLIAGETYYIRTYSSGNHGLERDFDICVKATNPPINDLAINAIDLTVNPDLNCTNITHGTTIFASQFQVNHINDIVDVGYDVWYKFVATDTKHIVSIEDFTGFHQPLINLYSGNYDNLNIVNTSDTYLNYFTANHLTIGETYYLQVGYYAPILDFSICVKTLPPPPANDECSNAFPVPVNLDINCTNSVHGTTINATPSPQFDGIMGATDDDVWFTFTATSSVHIIDLKNITENNDLLSENSVLGLGLYSGSCNNLSLIRSGYNYYSNTMLANNLNPGDIYYLRVFGYYYGFQSARVDFDVCVKTPLPPIVNDDLLDAIPITIGNSTMRNTSCDFQAWTMSDTVTESEMYGSCDGENTGLDVFYTWTATSNELLWNGGDGNPGIVIRDVNNNEITCAGTSAPSDTVLSGWNIGDHLIIQIYDYVGNFSDVSFCLQQHGYSSANENEMKELKYYPNPVTHTLNLSAINIIDNVSIFNVVGQKVLNINPNISKTQINLSRLKKGIYFVKVYVNKQSTAFKIIKE